MPTDQTVENDDDEEDRMSTTPLVSNRSIVLAVGFILAQFLFDAVWGFLYEEGLIDASPMNLPVYTFDAIFCLAFVAVCNIFVSFSIIFMIHVLRSVCLTIQHNAPSYCGIFTMTTAIIATICAFYFKSIALLLTASFGMIFGIPMSLGIDMVDIFVESLSCTLFLCDKCLLSIRLCCCTILFACAPSQSQRGKPTKNEGDEDPLLPVVEGLKASTVSSDQPCSKRASNRKKSNPTETCIEEQGGCDSE